MKKNNLNLFAVTLVASGIIGIATGCSTETTDPKVVKVAFAECGFGRQYLVEWEKGYNAMYPNDPIELDLEGDSQMTQNILTRITTETNLPDLVMVLSTNWEAWAVQGYLADLNDVYEADSLDGKGTLMKDFIEPAILNYGNVNGKYYAVPWSTGPSGIIYNVDMFEKYQWNIPTTYDELVSLCAKIKTDTKNKVAPFAWSTATGGYWDYVALDWWVQYSGHEEYEKFWKFENPEVYATEGRKVMLEKFYDLICDSGKAKNSIVNAKFMTSQMDFINQKAAMIVNGSWLENEMKENTPEGFRMKMMKTPVLSGAKDTTYQVAPTNDFIVIPKKAKNVEGAKKFLKYINSKEGCEIFTKYAGSFRPFQYDYSNVQGISEFVQSCADIKSTTTTLYQYSNNPMYYQNNANLFPGTGSPYVQMVQDDVSGEQMRDDCYNYAKKNWSSWQKAAGLN